jgi:outer membrane protein assembly factor BamD
MDQMRVKLEKKDWEAALQYYHIRNYHSASVALDAFLNKWPGSQHREEAMFTMLKAEHRLAMNSIERKKVQRLEQAIRSYVNFADAYQESKYRREADQINKELQNQLSVYNSN